MNQNAATRVGVHQVTPAQDRDCGSLSITAEPHGPARLAYDRRLASLNRHADGLTGLLTCDECGAVSRDWYDTGAGIEAFCDCNPRPGRSSHGWYRLKSHSAVYIDAMLERWSRDGVPS